MASQGYPHLSAQRFMHNSRLDYHAPALDELAAGYSTWLLRPFIDLGTAPESPLYVQGVDAAYSHLTQPDAPTLFLQIHPSADLRENVLQQSRLDAYRVATPADLPARLQTPRWARLAERYAAFAGSSRREQTHLCLLLETMGLHEANFLCLRTLPPIELDAPDAFPLEIMRVRAQHRVDGATSTYRHVLALERQAAASERLDPASRMASCLTLLVAFAKHRHRDVHEVQHWRAEALRHYRWLRPGENWADTIRASAFWRAVSYVPFLAGDREATTRELGLAEDLALQALALASDTPDEQIPSRQNLHPLLETRKREAEWCGDRDLALERAQRLAAHDSLDPKAHIHLGDALWAVRGPAAAAAAYRHAVRLGAPYLPLACFRLGNCLEELDDRDGARQAYLRCLHFDPRGWSAVERLLQDPDGLQPALHAWLSGVAGSLKQRLKARAADSADHEPDATART